MTMPTTIAIRYVDNRELTKPDDNPPRKPQETPTGSPTQKP